MRIDEFMEEMKKDNSPIVRRILDTESETVLIAAGGRELYTEFQEDKANIEVYAVVYGPINKMRYPEYFMFKDVKVTINYLSINFLLELFNEKYNFRPSWYQNNLTTDRHHTILMATNLLNLTDKYLIYKNEERLEQADFIMKNASDLGIIAFEAIVQYIRLNHFHKRNLEIEAYYPYLYLIIYLYLKILNRYIDIDLIKDVKEHKFIKELDDPDEVLALVIEIAKYVKKNKYDDEFRNKLLDDYNFLSPTTMTDNEKEYTLYSDLFLDDSTAEYTKVKDYNENLSLYLGTYYNIIACGGENFHYFTTDGKEFVGLYKEPVYFYDLKTFRLLDQPKYEVSKLDKVVAYDEAGNVIYDSSKEINEDENATNIKELDEDQWDWL